MYRGFNVKLEDSFFGRHAAHFHSKGQNIFDEGNNAVSTELDRFLNNEGILDAKKIQESWFPSIKANIFISHSHSDRDLVITLAGWLWEQLGVTSFIDACVWGYGDHLIEKIDNKYSKNGGRLQYSSIKKSASHVHMLLSTSLLQMIDKTECLFFINTPSAMKPKDTVAGTTLSPWIYSEIAATRIIRKRRKEEHRDKMHVTAATEDVKAAYPIDTSHLHPLTERNLLEWKSAASGNTGISALDKLYKSTPFPSEGLILG